MEIFNVHKTVVDFYDMLPTGRLKKNPRHCWLLYCKDGLFIDLNRSDLTSNIMEKFQGQPYASTTYLFFDKQNALDTLEWIESQYVAYKLKGDDNKNHELKFTVLKSRNI